MDTTTSSPKSAITSDDEMIRWWMVTRGSVWVWFKGMSMLRGGIFIGVEAEVKVSDVNELDIGKYSF